MVFQLWISLSRRRLGNRLSLEPRTRRNRSAADALPRRAGSPGIAAGDNRVLIRANQLFSFRYLSNHATVRRIESIWFSRFSKPWPSFG